MMKSYGNILSYAYSNVPAKRKKSHCAFNIEIESENQVTGWCQQIKPFRLAKEWHRKNNTIQKNNRRGNDFKYEGSLCMCSTNNFVEKAL